MPFCTLQVLQYFHTYFSLINMLWFIMYTGFSSPANNKYSRNSIYLIT